VHDLSVDTGSTVVGAGRVDAVLSPVVSVSSVVSSLPSPSSNGVEILDVTLRMYGLMIACGVLAAVWLSRKRWAERGGDPEDISTIALWAVPAGLIGARLYHVITDWKKYFPDRPLESLYIWQGGLGIPGGILLGVCVGALVARRMGLRLPVALDVVAPAIPLAQAIGRLGNWWNQELFGGPTDLPWGLQIDAANRPTEYLAFETFHPTFLYEGLWNLGVVVFILWLDRKRVVRPGNLFALYIAGYFIGRFWVEAMRSDPASLILGIRVNLWTSSLVVLGVAVVFLVRGLKRKPDDNDEPYVDGHRFDPGQVEPAEEADVADEPSDVEVDDDDSSPDPDGGGPVDGARVAATDELLPHDSTDDT